MRIFPEQRIVQFTLTYFGPGFAGKQAALRYIFNKTRPEAKGPWHDVYHRDDGRGRQVWFELIALSLPHLAGYRVSLRLQTNSGSLWTPESRRVSLEGADGVMFVARDDTTPWDDRNTSALKMLDQFLAEGVAQAVDVPRVFSYNKLRMPPEEDTMSIPEIAWELDRKGRPSFETVALDGANVFAALKALVREVLAPWEADPQRILAVARQ